jgi:hypothetical protein
MFAEEALRARITDVPEFFFISHLRESNLDMPRLMIDIIRRAYKVPLGQNGSVETAMNQFGAAEYSRCMEEK